MAGSEGGNTGGGAGRRDRILRIVLVVSLALNLLVLGVPAGGMIKGEQRQRMHSASDLRTLWMVMPEEVRDEMRRAAGPRGDGDHAAAREERRARAAARDAEILALLRAPEFDAQAFTEALDAEHAERAERIARAHQAFVARVAQLDAAERSAVADRIEEGTGRRLPGR